MPKFFFFLFRMMLFYGSGSILLATWNAFLLPVFGGYGVGDYRQSSGKKNGMCNWSLGELFFLLKSSYSSLIREP